jgi:hypothetical protein
VLVGVSQYLSMWSPVADGRFGDHVTFRRGVGDTFDGLSEIVSSMISDTSRM